MALYDLVGGAVDLGRLGHVHENHVRRLAGLLHLGPSGLRHGAVEVGDDHLRAGLGERLATGKADAPAAAGDHRDAPVEAQFLHVHGGFLLLSPRTGVLSSFGKA